MNIELLVMSYLGLGLCGLWAGLFVGVGVCLLWRIRSIRRGSRGIKRREQERTVSALALVLDAGLRSVPVVLVLLTCSCWFIARSGCPWLEPTAGVFATSACLSFLGATAVEDSSQLW